MIGALLDMAFVRGLAVGFALAAPMGPVAVLCIRRALARGRTQAFIAGLGAALADMVFGAIAGLGITVVSAFVLTHEMAIGIIGGTLVTGFGLVTYRAPIVTSEGIIQMKSLRRDFAAAFSMAITNPATMIAAVGVFAAFAPVDVYTEPARAFWLVGGVLIGSAIWWLILALAAGMLRAHLSENLSRLNHFSGAIITLSGAGVLIFTLAKMMNAN